MAIKTMWEMVKHGPNSGGGVGNGESQEQPMLWGISWSVLYNRQGKRTEDELLRRGKHVKRESDLILVAFALQPSDQIRGR